MVHRTGGALSPNQGLVRIPKINPEGFVGLVRKGKDDQNYWQKEGHEACGELKQFGRAKDETRDGKDQVCIPG